MKKLKTIMILSVTLCLVGCTNREIGTSVGGLAGFMLGSTLGKGNGAVAGAALGTALGATAGNALGGRADKADKHHDHQYR